jgi:hypothetical protein
VDHIIPVILAPELKAEFANLEMMPATLNQTCITLRRNESGSPPPLCRMLVNVRGCRDMTFINQDEKLMASDARGRVLGAEGAEGGTAG